MNRRPRIIAFAYACEPDKGSEPGAGWNWSQMLSELGDTWIVTRSNNQAAIESALQGVRRNDGPHFVFVDLPSWASHWKRGQRGVHVYYLLWQILAVRAARKLARIQAFDIVWHLTFANVWLGSLAPLVPGGFVLGPVGGGVDTVWRLSASFGPGGFFKEFAREIVRKSARYLNPVARFAWSRANIIFVQNPETQSWLPRRHQHKVRILPHAIAAEPRERPDRSHACTALYAGRLVDWKGVSLAILALQAAPDWSLIVHGSGSAERRLRSLAVELNVLDRVDFRGWTTRSQLARTMGAEADALLFPSIRDDAPLVVAEALSMGLPIVCLDRGGPPLLAGEAAFIANSRGSATDVAHALAERLREAAESDRRVVARQRARELTADARVRELRHIIRDLTSAGALHCGSD